MTPNIWSPPVGVSTLVTAQAFAIGNENCGPRTGAQYPFNWYAIATKVRAKHPSLPLILGCETQEQTQAMLKAEPRISELADMVDVHQRKSPEEFLAAAHEFDTYPRTKFPKAFVSEYSSPRKLFPNSTTVAAAVAEAIYMAGMEANGDVVQLATYGDLMANTNDQHGSSGVSTIVIGSARSFGTPSWVVQKLFMHAQPARLVPSVLEMTGKRLLLLFNPIVHISIQEAQARAPCVLLPSRGDYVDTSGSTMAHQRPPNTYTRYPEVAPVDLRR